MTVERGTKFETRTSEGSLWSRGLVWSLHWCTLELGCPTLTPLVCVCVSTPPPTTPAIKTLSRGTGDQKPRNMPWRHRQSCTRPPLCRGWEEDPPPHPHTHKHTQTYKETCDFRSLPFKSGPVLPFLFLEPLFTCCFTLPLLCFGTISIWWDLYLWTRWASKTKVIKCSLSSAQELRFCLSVWPVFSEITSELSWAFLRVFTKSSSD